MFVREPLAVALAVTAAAAIVSAGPAELHARSAALPLARVSNVQSIRNLVRRDQSRIAAANRVRSAATPMVISVPATNQDVFYTVPISIGGTTWTLLVDTGCKLLH